MTHQHRVTTGAMLLPTVLGFATTSGSTPLKSPGFTDDVTVAAADGSKPGVLQHS